jgi:hypothetical protein
MMKTIRSLSRKRTISLSFAALALVGAVLTRPVAADGIYNPGSGGGAPTGAAGGYLSGTYPNPVVNKVLGVTSGNAAAGDVGEYIGSPVASGSAVSLTANTPANVTSISLAAGDWDVSAIALFNGASTTTVTYLNAFISQVSATIDTTTAGAEASLGYPLAGFNAFPTSAPTSLSIPPLRISVSSTTTIYLVVQSGFGSGTANAYGIIRARRLR